MENPHESGTVAWELFEAGSRFEKMAVLDQRADAATDAANERTLALYRVGAAMSAALIFIGSQLGELNSVSESIDRLARAVDGLQESFPLPEKKTTGVKKKKRRK